MTENRSANWMQGGRVEPALIDMRLDQTLPGSLSGSEMVLVVEDDAAMRATLTAGLRMHGFRTLRAANGMDALHLAERYTGKIHALVTDVDLPEVDGIELAVLMKAARPHVQVLFLAGGISGERDAVEAMVPGSGFIESPCEVDRIARELRDVLARGEAALEQRV